ncbi:hypothetical protein POV27_12150 [Aureisphaera galaxeae]|uniref:hypothetical protein n=1 Tax=Aureisphaera galaxeae TaxID=1538023 RepID=UPI0023507347|nr:hypothetical protein [Aureisphaera galaxeae]MDC8004807.1 hypothetical protein [Aureisphaera galaxeae]
MENTFNSVQELDSVAHIRKRPGMYLGRINMKGFTDLLKGILSESLTSLQADSISFAYSDSRYGKIMIQNIQNPVIDNWSRMYFNETNPFTMGILPLNALSKTFTLKLIDSASNPLLEQTYEKGILKNGAPLEKGMIAASLEISFELDDEIWSKDFTWNEGYMNHVLQEFAFLYKKVSFHSAYEVHGSKCNTIYHFKNGLQDRLEIETLKGLGGSYFNSYIDEQIGDFHLEAAFAFRDYTVDEPFLKSYVNDYYTHENGSHVDGLLKGLTYGVMKYFQKHQLTEVYKISEKGMQENLMAAINIRMKAPTFSGCVKNKLASPEVVEPIAEFVANILFRKIEKDEASTQKLIRKFEI